jgi:hypothetical protein
MEEKDSRAASIRHHLIMSSKTGPDGLNDQWPEVDSQKDANAEPQSGS